jgi:hypothetical protein
MTRSNMGLDEAFALAMDLGKGARDGAGIVGYGVVSLHGPDGRLKDVEPFMNKITTLGDEYYARRGVAGIGTPNIAQPTLMNGMKLGTGTTAVAKSGAGSALVTYITGSNQLFDTTHPALTDLSADTGWDAVYKCTWGAGDVTNAAMTARPLSPSHASCSLPRTRRRTTPWRSPGLTPSTGDLNSSPGVGIA